MNYQEFITKLFTMQDKNYQKWEQKFISTKYEIIGIRTKDTLKIAKEILKNNHQEFLNKTNKYYEELNIKGYVLAKSPYLLQYIDEYVKKIDNWATCDTFATHLKTKYKAVEPKIEKYLQSPKPFTIRFALVVILLYYLKEENLPQIFQVISNIKNDNYYVKMAISWLLAECYIKYPNKALIFFQNNNLSAFIQNKAISKINDSYRVTKENKKIIKAMRK